MRELRGTGLVDLKYVPTDRREHGGHLSFFTKILDRQPFERHCRTLLNQAAEV